MDDLKNLLEEIAKRGVGLAPLPGGQLHLIGGKSLPDELKARLRVAKPSILDAMKSGAVPIGEPPRTAAEFYRTYGCNPWALPFDEPHAGRASLLPEIVGGQLWHWCSDCGRWGLFGAGVDLQQGRLGEWRCGLHHEKK